MQIDIITIFPDMFEDIFDWGIIAQAKKSNLINIKVHDLRDYTHDKHRQVDDRPFGGGPGMVLKPEPLFEAIEDLKSKTPEASKSKVIFLTPKGETLTQQKAENLAENENNLIMICGRYEGVDQRVIDQLVDEEISIGNYVLSGGEIPAMVLIDSIVRLIPGAIKNVEFNDSESFSNAEDRAKLDYPQYTRPEEYKGMRVPEVLLSGDHGKIADWRKNR